MVSVYISFFRDYVFIESVIKQVQGFADEIILVDGPNFSSLAGFASVGIPVDMKNCKADFYNVIQDLECKDKISYHWGIWENERHKRKFAYDLCKGEICLTIDADEIIDFDEDFLQNFKNSNAIVGGVNCLNMYKTDVFLGGDFYDYTNNVSQKNIIFKKDFVDSTRQLDYLWLVNHTANKIKSKELYNGKSLGTMYHATSMRDNDGKLIKSVFYQSFHRENASIQELGKWSSQISKKAMDPLLQHTSNALMGFPLDRKYFLDPFKNSRNKSILADISIISKKITINDNRSSYDAELRKGEYWFRLKFNENESSASMRWKNSENNEITMNIYKILDGEYPKKCENSEFVVEKSNEFVSVSVIDTNLYIAEPVVQFIIK